MSEYDFYESAVVRMLDRQRFPLPWYVEEAPGCFVVRDRNGQAFAHVYCDDNPRAKLLTWGRSAARCGQSGDAARKNRYAAARPTKLRARQQGCALLEGGIMKWYQCASR